MYKIFYLFRGKENPFHVDIDGDSTMGHLKDLIKLEALVTLEEVDACSPNLFKINAHGETCKERTKALEEELQRISSDALLDALNSISDLFPVAPPAKTIHILVQLPPSESIHSRACGAIADMHPPNCNYHPNNLLYTCTLQQWSLSLWLLLMLSVYFNDSLMAPLSSNSTQQPAFCPSNHSVNICTLVTPLSLCNTIAMYLSAGAPYYPILPSYGACVPHLQDSR